MLRPPDIIRKKRDGEALSPEEIAFFVNGCADGSIADYHVAAWLMAVYLNGLDDAEQAALTETMWHSGETLDWSQIAAPKVDKHSTGGVGDKTSLILAPVVAACGGVVPMISGRGLGHTGGTLDKLESIPGYRVRLPVWEARAVLEMVGFVMMGQTDELAPADRRLYSMRDATSTVECIPLVVGSIMSKKLAAGLDALVLDVKTGTGAFMREEARAQALARALVATGNRCGVKTEALITDMNQPLGGVGHAIEVRECIALLKGETDDVTRPTLELSLELAARMLAVSGLCATLDEARTKAREALDSGAAFDKFARNVAAQGGDYRVCDDPVQHLAVHPCEVRVESPGKGYVQQVETAAIGLALARIGGGRVRVEDAIDAAVGYKPLARIGDEVNAGDALGLVYGCTEDEARQAAAEIQAAYRVGEEKADAPELVKEVITA
jgi:pyrimidine-nucleoside phosphorylase